MTARLWGKSSPASRTWLLVFQDCFQPSLIRDGEAFLKIFFIKRQTWVQNFLQVWRRTRRETADWQLSMFVRIRVFKKPADDAVLTFYGRSRVYSQALIVWSEISDGTLHYACSATTAGVHYCIQRSFVIISYSISGSYHLQPNQSALANRVQAQSLLGYNVVIDFWSSLHDRRD